MEFVDEYQSFSHSPTFQATASKVILVGPFEHLQWSIEVHFGGGQQPPSSSSSHGSSSSFLNNAFFWWQRTWALDGMFQFWKWISLRPVAIVPRPHSSACSRLEMEFRFQSKWNVVLLIFDVFPSKEQPWVDSLWRPSFVSERSSSCSMFHAHLSRCTRTYWSFAPLFIDIFSFQRHDILAILYEYVRYFYHSTSKSLFMRTYQMNPPHPDLNPEESALWLWAAHNKINQYLYDLEVAKNVRRTPKSLEKSRLMAPWREEPNVCRSQSFPDSSICSLCYAANGKFRSKRAILRYLYAVFTEGKIISSEDLSWNYRHTTNHGMELFRCQRCWESQKHPKEYI